jgi:MFS family permease
MNNKLVTAPNKKSILSILFIGWIVLFIDRTVISLAVVQISEDLTLSPSQIGLVLSSFFLGYAFMQIPGGYLADRFGSRKVIIAAVLLWSLFTALTGLAWSITSLILLRVLFGIGEGAYPAAAAKAVSDYFPRKERTKAQSTMMSSNPIGMVLAPLICAPLLGLLGWRSVFILISLLGVVIVIFVWKFIGNTAKNNEKNETATQKEKGVYKELLRDLTVWKMMIIFFGVCVAQWGLTAWMPTYLFQVKNINLTSAGMLTAIPALVLAVVAFMSGRLIDKLGSYTKMVVITSPLIIALFVYLLTNASTVTQVILYQSLASIGIGFMLSFAFSLPHRLFNPKVVGTSVGMINFGGQSAGILAPTIMGSLISASGGSYTNAFLFVVGCGLLAAIVAMTLPGSKLVKVQVEEVTV